MDVEVVEMTEAEGLVFARSMLEEAMVADSLAHAQAFVQSALICLPK